MPTEVRACANRAQILSGRLGFTLPGVQTRYLIIAALITALVILGASLVWFLMAVT